MRILHLLSNPNWSGPAENVALLALAQRALGHQASIAVERKRLSPRAEEPVIPRLKALDLLDEGGLELSVKSTPLALLRDVRRISRREEDVLHCHFSHDHHLCRIGRPRRAVLVRSIHSPRSLGWGLPRADAYTVPTAADAARLPNRRVRVMPSLLDPGFRPAASVPALRERLGVRGEPLVGMVSNFHPSRRHELGFRAFAQLRGVRPGAHLAIVGDGELEEALRGKVRELGLEPAVTWAGYQQAERFVEWLQALDEVWLLGLGNDWSGRAAAQARACGVRVVAVDEGALPGLADAVVRELTPEAVVRASLSGERVSRTLRSNEEVARAVLDLYEQARAGR